LKSGAVDQGSSARLGLIHLLVQRKGWFYHVYPLAIGLACWGAWGLASLPPWRAAACLLATAITPVWLAQEDALIRTRMYHVLHSASAMQAALEDRLPRGARVQVLDSDYGAFLAMARAGMRQATPHIQWFSLVFAEDSVRHRFLAALEDNPPAAILLTNSPVAAAARFRCRRSLAEVCGAVGIRLCPRPIQK
jgi:hypothetical protein